MRQALHRSSILLLLALSTGASAQTSRIELISKVHPRHVSDTGMGGSEAQAISADGRYFVFQERGAQPRALAGRRQPGLRRVRLRPLDRDNGVGQPERGAAHGKGNFSSSDAAISRDGRYVVFTSLAEDLVPGQQDENSYLLDDVFLFDRITGTMELVSHTSSSRTVTLSGDARQPVISADGSSAAFTISSNLYLYDRSSGKNTRRASVRTHSFTPIAKDLTPPVLSSARTGNALAFTCTAWDLTPLDFNVAPPRPDPEFGIYNSSSDVFVYSVDGSAALAGTGNVDG